MRVTGSGKAQAIIVSGFLIAIGIVAIIALLNSAVLSVGEQPETNEEDVDAVTNYRDTIATESEEALRDVNDIATRKGLNNSQVNQTYVDYVEQINERMQQVYSGQGLVGISDVNVNSTFNNAWRVRKNRTTPPTKNTRDPFDTAFVIDTSGSMDWNDNSDQRVEAAQGFVGDLRGLDRAAIVDFDDDSGYERNGIYAGLTPAGDGSSKDELNSTLEYLGDASGATYLGGGIREANEVYRRSGNSSHDNVMVALTDGVNTQGWVHFEDKYVFSCGGSGNCDDELEWSWRHEWGFGGRNADKPGDWVCISERRGDPDCESWDDSNDEPEYHEDESRGWRIGDSENIGESGLNGRTLHQAEVAADMETRIYTVLLKGTGSTNETLLKEIASRTGGKYYDTTDPDELTSIFRRIYDDASRPQPIASGVNRTYRMNLNVSDFPDNGNVTLRVNNTSTGNLLWRMRVTNQSTSHPSPSHIVIDDGNNVVQKYDYSLLGGTPIDIDVMSDTINGYRRNMSTGLFNSGNGTYNTTLEYSASVANVTYDFRVDQGSNVTNSLCPSPPCAKPDQQTVGSIHNANFTISYQNENIDYSEPIELEVNPVEEDVETGSSSNPTTASSSERLEFSTPVYDYQAYYPFDQEGNPGGWPQEHAFDGSGKNNTMALQPDEPSVDNDGAEQGIFGNSDDRAYSFDGNDYVRDLDGWNNIPINGTWTISLWFKASGSNDGVLLDASRDNGFSSDHRVFQIATRNDGGGLIGSGDSSVIWSYEDRNGNQATVSGEFDSGFLTPVPVLGDWHHVAVLGGWNNDRTQLFIDGQPVNGTAKDMGGKPMQAVVDGDRYGPLYVGNSIEPATGRPGTDGFEGNIDDVRIYHTDLSNVSSIQNSGGGGGGPGGGGGSGSYSEDFEEGGSVPSGWNVNNQVHGDDAGMTDDPSLSGTGDWSIYTAGGRLESPEINLSATSSAELSYYIMDGDDCGSSCYLDDPEGDDTLYVEYTSDSVTGWNTLETLDADTSPTPDTRSVSIPNDGRDTGFQVRYRNPNADSYVTWWGANREYDHWIIDNLEVTSTAGGGGGGGGGGGSTGNVTGTAGFIKQVFNDTKRGYITTGWQNFTDEGGVTPNPVAVDGLRLENVDAELNGGDISIWVQSDTDNDGEFEEVSDQDSSTPGNQSILLDGSGSYKVRGLSENNYRFRLKVKVDHPDTTDTPKFYNAELVGS